jgi:putative membrane protein
LHGLPRQLAASLDDSLFSSRPGKMLGQVLADPRVCWLAASTALIAWHIPAIFALGMRSAAWHLFEQLSFLATGMLFWRPIVQPPEAASRQDLSMVLYLFFATLPCDILSGFLVFSDRVVYPMYFSSSHLFGFSPLIDQQCAAALMWTCVTIVYFVAGVIMTMRFLSPRGLSPVNLQLGLVQNEIAPRASQALGSRRLVSQNWESV